jgi:hypothetical protein
LHFKSSERLVSTTRPNAVSVRKMSLVHINRNYVQKHSLQTMSRFPWKNVINLFISLLSLGFRSWNLTSVFNISSWKDYCPNFRPSSAWISLRIFRSPYVVYRVASESPKDIHPKDCNCNVCRDVAKTLISLAAYSRKPKLGYTLMHMTRIL